MLNETEWKEPPHNLNVDDVNHSNHSLKCIDEQPAVISDEWPVVFSLYSLIYCVQAIQITKINICLKTSGAAMFVKRKVYFNIQVTLLNCMLFCWIFHASFARKFEGRLLISMRPQNSHQMSFRILNQATELIIIELNRPQSVNQLKTLLAAREAESECGSKQSERIFYVHGYWCCCWCEWETTRSE